MMHGPKNIKYAVKQWWNNKFTQQNRETAAKYLSPCRFPTTNFTQTALVFNLSTYSQKSATNRLNYGTTRCGPLRVFHRELRAKL